MTSWRDGDSHIAIDGNGGSMQRKLDRYVTFQVCEGDLLHRSKLQHCYNGVLSNGRRD